MIIRKRGSQLEHAVLLCGLLLGMGISSFVAIGKVKRRPYVWVISIMEQDNDFLASESTFDTEDFDDFSPIQISYSNTDGGPPLVFHRRKFRQLSEAVARQARNRTLQVVHWDPVT
ncbi:hypothetical protein HK100_005640, partial [Physocladia obscura]